jgi:putative ABC transport system substrate-binding protein
MLQAAADSLGLKLQILHASAEHDFDSVFESLAQSRAGGLLLVPDLFFVGRIEQIAALTVRHAVPAIFQFREFAAAGGLMSYGGNLTDAYHQLGLYSGRILKGEKPADMPIQQFTKVELIINLKTAKTLGITFPITLLGRADEVIE